jgi:hypothetical protein
LIYGKAFDAPGGSLIHYDLNIKSRLSSLIQASPCLPANSKNPNDWKLQATYLGNILHGEAQGQADYQLFSVSAQ